MTSASLLSNNITFDRCYVHGTPTGTIKRGIALNGQYVAVVDSYISDCHSQDQDAQAIGSWTGWGPFKIVNNYLEGTGENYLTGGSDTYIQDCIMSDIEFSYNHCKKPLSWLPGHPSYAGIDWSVKNLFELKNAQRVLVNGNIFENNWVDSQSGYAILLTPRNSDGGNPWTVVQDVTITNNILRHSAAGFNTLGDDYVYPSAQTKRILIKDNIVEDINGAVWKNPASSNGDGVAFLFGSGTVGSSDVIIDHNTVFHTGCVILADGTSNSNFIFRNNIIRTMNMECLEAMSVQAILHWLLSSRV